MDKDFQFAGVIPYCWDGEKMAFLLRLGAPPPTEAPGPNTPPPPPQFKEYGGARNCDDSVLCAAHHFLAAMTGGLVQPSPEAIQSVADHMKEVEGKASFLFYNTKNSYCIYFVQMCKELMPVAPSNWVPVSVIKDQYEQPGLLHDRLVLEGDAVVEFKQWLTRLEQQLMEHGGMRWEPPIPKVPTQPPQPQNNEAASG